MKQNNIFRFKLKTLFFLIIFFVVALEADMSVTDIRGLDAIVEENYKHLSLINGLVWWDNHLVENLYRNGNREDATVQLVKDLFYLQRDLVTFDVTTLQRNPARYFKESTIGAILATVEPYRKYSSLSAEMKKELFMQLKKSIKDDINFNELYRQAQQIKGETVSRALRISEDYVHLVTLQKVTQEIKIIREEQKKASKKEFAAVSKKLTEKIEEQKRLTQQFGSLSQLEKKPAVKKVYAQLHQEDLSKKNLKNIVNVIIAAFDENLSSKNHYLPFTFQNIFLAFLWKIVETKKDLVPFIDSFKAQYHDDQVFNQAALEKYLSMDPYNKNDFESLKKKFESGVLVKNVFQNYEEIIFYLYASNIWYNVLPPIVDNIGRANYEGIELPDCVETAIRNFINILIFNPDFFVFTVEDAEKVSKEGIVFSEKFHNFYLRYSNPLKSQFLEVHNAWLVVVSALLDVLYRKPVEEPFCEIKTSFLNVMKVINHVMFGNAASFDNLSNTKKLDLLCASARYLNLTWESVVAIDDKKFDTNVSLIFKHNKKPIFEWIFSPNHSYLISLLRTANLPIIHFSALIKNFQANPSSYQDVIHNNKIVTIISFNIGQALIDVISLAKDPVLIPIITQLLENLIPLLNLGDMFAIAKKIVLNKKSELYPLLEEIVKKDLLQAHDIFYVIVKYQIRELYNLIDRYFSQLSKEKQRVILQLIVSVKVSELYPLVERGFENFNEAMTKAILKNNEKALFGLLEHAYDTKNKKRMFKFFKLVIKFDADYFYPVLISDSTQLNQEEHLELIKRIFKKQRVPLYTLATQLGSSLPHKTAKKIKKALVAQEQSGELIKITEQVKNALKDLLESPSENNLDTFIADTKQFKDAAVTFKQTLPRSEAVVPDVYIRLLKNIKKLWNTFFEEMNDLLQEVPEDALNHKIKGLKLKKYIENSIEQIEMMKDQEIKILNKKIVSLKNK